jgi:cytochrome c oxidase subunit IV
MAGSSPEEIKKGIRAILIIGGVLSFLTVVTVGLSMYEMPTHNQNILLGMILAAGKVCLVGGVFMHLFHEKKLIFKILTFSLVFLLAIFFLTYFSNLDPLVFDRF